MLIKSVHKQVSVSNFADTHLHMQAHGRHSVLGQGTQTGGGSSLEDVRQRKKQVGQLIQERSAGRKERVHYCSQELAVIDMLERNMIADIDHSRVRT